MLEEERWIPQLASVLELQRAAGRRLFILAATTESEQQLAGVLAATGAQRTLVVCLAADSAVIERRLERREPDGWPGKHRLISHARSLAATMPGLKGVDLLIDTEERQAEDIARQLHVEMSSRGLLIGADG